MTIRFIYFFFFVDAVNWQNISECDVPACRVVPCKNAGVCVQNNEDVNDYTCQCVYPYSGKNCEEKYACEVNVCNGGKCLNSSMSGIQCLCPFGRGGLTCNQGDMFYHTIYSLSSSLTSVFCVSRRSLAHSSGILGSKRDQEGPIKMHRKEDLKRLSRL